MRSALLVSLRRSSCLPRHLLLLHRINELLEGVSHELQVLQPRKLALFNARVDGEETRLVHLLGFDQSIDPVLLPLFKRLDHLRLMQQVFLIFAEILGTDVFNLSKLLVVLALQFLSVILRVFRCLIDICPHLLKLSLEHLLESFASVLDIFLHVTLVLLDSIIDRTELVEIELVIFIEPALNLLFQSANVV